MGASKAAVFVRRSCDDGRVVPGMSQHSSNDPLHGVTLKAIVEDLVDRRGFADLARRIKIRCFEFEPSIQSSLKFLRRTQWARSEVEKLYLADHRELREH
jgi:uncharacterized protein (DUF2132 family)